MHNRLETSDGTTYISLLCVIQGFYKLLFLCVYLVGESCSPDGSVRLVDGQDEAIGRIEFCASGVWGTICGNGWDENDAQVACRQLGYEGF